MKIKLTADNLNKENLILFAKEKLEEIRNDPKISEERKMKLMAQWQKRITKFS